VPVSFRTNLSASPLAPPVLLRRISKSEKSPSRAGKSLLDRSSRTDLSMLVARALKIGKIADGGMPPTYETMH
jgi:hypothetical protein